MSNILERLTEGVVQRNVVKEGAALLNKWSKTGLLEGLDTDYDRQSMAVLLENQAKELLREANVQGAASGSGVQGFAAVAFPLVRRVFGGLLANDLVSVQPMSLPSGLIFFLDFTKSSERDNTEGQSIHGQGVVGSEIIDGVTLGENGFYDLSQGYSSARGSAKAFGDGGETSALTLDAAIIDMSGALTEAQAKLLDFDPDLISEAEGGDSTAAIAVCTLDVSKLAESTVTDPDAVGGATTGCEVTPGQNLSAQMTPHHVMTLALSADSSDAVTGMSLVRRLTKRINDAGDLRVVLRHATTLEGNQPFANGAAATNPAQRSFDLTFAIGDNITEVSGSLGALQATATWELESTLADPFGNGSEGTSGADGMNIPEIDIKVDSTAITATTRKMKAKWSPELGQDLNAYHNLDAEVELTQVLSEQIALEIDQEILKDLITQAKADTRYWSRVPGRFLNAGTGAPLGDDGGDFTGTVSEWYETLIETINDVSAQIHRKTLRGGANFLVCGPEVANILEFTSGFRASVTHDDDKGTVGAVREGSINKKFDLYVDPYFPRQIILVGRKGSSFLESGYVYAPYVPLQTTPTIFGPEDFTPRKGVMTRYGKKMVRPDMYGLVLVRDLVDSPTGD
jgi:hypothetical protein